MSRQNPVKLLIFLLFVLIAMGGLALLKGGLYVGQHEGDTLHVVEIILRMAAGEVPHLDFMTPIGAMAFAPIAFFVDRGAGLGHAILYAQIAVGAALLPAAWWVGRTRLGPVSAYFFGFVIIVLATALVHGGAKSSISISMHYNRWAWAVAFIAIAVALLPPRRAANGAVDGVIVGLAMAFLALIKVTYFAAFAVPVVVALVLRRNFRALGVALVCGLGVAVAVTLWAGVEYWQAYLNDLLSVARSEVRPEPGEPFIKIVTAPAYLGGSLAVLLSVVLLRQAHEATGGLVLLLLAPGFFYVTYQNFGNDPQWLLLLPVMLFALRPDGDVVNELGWNLRSAVSIVGAGALAFALPSFLNLTYSPIAHLNVDRSAYMPLLPRRAAYADLQVATIRASRVDGQMALDGPGSGLEAYEELAARDAPGMLMGEALPRCKIVLGLPAWIDAIVKDLEAAGLAEDKRVFVTDIFSSHWLFSDRLRPLKHGAPWYYGGLSGFDSADYLLVPICPVAPNVRKEIIDEVMELDGVTLREIRRTPLYILLEKGGA